MQMLDLPIVANIAPPQTAVVGIRDFINGLIAAIASIVSINIAKVDFILFDELNHIIMQELNRIVSVREMLAEATSGILVRVCTPVHNHPLVILANAFDIIEDNEVAETTLYAVLNEASIFFVERMEEVFSILEEEVDIVSLVARRDNYLVLYGFANSDKCHFGAFAIKHLNFNSSNHRSSPVDINNIVN
jgi:hypothetical protein